MTDHKNKLDNNLIKEALRREMDSIDAPPAGRAWQNIELALEKHRSPARQRSFVWSRAAAVAAACLVLVLGGIGIYRSFDIMPLADFGAAPEASDEVGLLTVDEAADQPEIIEEDTAREQYIQEPPVGEVDLSPPDWPASLPGNYILGDTVTLSEEGEPGYAGAVYYSPDVDLLLVKKETGDQELSGFLELLGVHIEADIRDIDEINGFVYFTAGELSGLAWHENGRYQALLVLSGEMVQEELEDLAAAME